MSTATAIKQSREANLSGHLRVSPVLSSHIVRDKRAELAGGFDQR